MQRSPNNEIADADDLAKLEPTNNSGRDMNFRYIMTDFVYIPAISFVGAQIGTTSSISSDIDFKVYHENKNENDCKDEILIDEDYINSGSTLGCYEHYEDGKVNEVRLNKDAEDGELSFTALRIYTTVNDCSKITEWDFTAIDAVYSPDITSTRDVSIVPIAIGDSTFAASTSSAHYRCYPAIKITANNEFLDELPAVFEWNEATQVLKLKGSSVEVDTYTVTITFQYLNVISDLSKYVKSYELFIGVKPAVFAIENFEATLNEDAIIINLPPLATIIPNTAAFNPMTRTRHVLYANGSPLPPDNYDWDNETSLRLNAINFPLVGDTL